jgi:hypothetical protein
LGRARYAGRLSHTCKGGACANFWALMQLKRLFSDDPTSEPEEGRSGSNAADRPERLLRMMTRPLSTLRQSSRRSRMRKNSDTTVSSATPSHSHWGYYAGSASRGDNSEEKVSKNEKGPENRGLGVELCPSSGPAQATSSSSEQLSSSGQPFWLRSSSIDSP